MSASGIPSSRNFSGRKTSRGLGLRSFGSNIRRSTKVPPGFRYAGQCVLLMVTTRSYKAFVQKVLGDTSATMSTILASIGDRLGLFKDLAANGPAASLEIARRTGTNERYVREWLGGMTSAGYLEYDASTGQFSLPAEHAAAVAAEGGPFFFGGIHEMIPALVTVIDQVTEAFRKGGGVRQANYPSAMWDGLERFTAGWFNNFLVQ